MAKSYGANGADIELVVGVAGGSSISGTSGALIKSQLENIFSALNNDKNNKKLRLVANLNISSTRSAINSQISALNKGKDVKGLNNLKLTVGSIDTKSAVANFKKELETMLKQVKVSTGFQVTVGSDGAASAMKTIAESSEAATNAIAATNAALDQLKVIGASIKKDYSSLRSQLGGGSAIGEAKAAVDALDESFLKMDTAIQKLKAGSNANTYQGLISSAYEAKDACEQLIATQKRILEGTEYAPPSVDTWTAAYDNMSQAAEEYIAATESASQRAEAVEQERLESESVAAELEAQIAAKRESYAQQQVANEQIITEAVESSQARHAEVMEAVAESEQQSYAERQAGIQNLATTISNLAAKEAEQQRQDDATIAQAEANEKAITALQARISSALSVVTSKSPEARTELEGISTELEKMKADVFSVDSSKLESMAQTVGTLASQFEGVALPAEQARGKIEEVEMYYSKLKTRINTLDFNMLTDNDTDIKSKLESILQQFSKLEVQMDGLNASGDRVTQEQIDNILAAEVALKGLLDTTTNLRKENDLASKNSVSEVLSNYSKLSSQFKKFSFESLSASSDEAKSNLEALRGKMQELDSAVKSIKVNADSATDEQIQKVKELESEAAELVDKCRQSEQELKNAPKTINSLLASSETMLNSTNEKYAEQRNAIIEARVELEKMKNSTETVDVAKLKELEKVILNNGEALREAGAYSKTFGDSLKTSVTKVLELVGGYRLLMSGVRVLREAVDIVVDVDDAMTELKKVTDETTVAYDNFLDSATERAVTYGSTLSDIVSATADFARLGYDMADASEMANAAIVYQNVGDDIDSIDDASESLISTMQAFGLEASDVMSIVDKFNAIGNSFAISSGGAGEALLRSAAAMEAAGNTLDQTLALAAAANTIVQDPEKVGTTLKTLSMYLRAAKTEAEEAGIETDGMAESVSELRDEILALTGNQVDIQIDED